MELTQDILRSLLRYNPTTGEFTWLASQYRIKAGDVAGSKRTDGYIAIGVGGKLYKAHRLAFLYMEGEFPKDQVDHLNGIKIDNSWANLRKCTPIENMNNPVTVGKMKELAIQQWCIKRTLSTFVF
jgi:hypothetical protein